MKKQVRIGSEVYRLRFYINGWREGEEYFKSIGRFSDSEMDEMISGKAIKKNGNTFRFRYEDEYGHEYTVQEILGREV